MMVSPVLDNFYRAKNGQKIVNYIIDIIHNNVELRRKNTLCIGYSGDFLSNLDCHQLFYAIPNQHKISHWPKIRPFKTVVIDEVHMPFRPNTWDVVLLIHHIEYSKNVGKLLTEINRILKNYGKLIVIFMNYFNPYQTKSFGRITSYEVINFIYDAKISITNISGINKNLKIWPYSFSYDINHYNSAIIKFFPFLSDVVVVTSEKIETASEFAIPLKEQYEIL